MADFFTPLILSLCVGTPTAYNNACQKSVQSAYIQSGWQKEANSFQSGAMSYGKKEEKETFGSTTWLVNLTAASAVAVEKKKAVIPLPKFGFFDKISTDIEPNKYGLNFGWHWWNYLEYYY